MKARTPRLRYSQDIVDRICKLLIGEDTARPKSLRQICQMKGMPKLSTVFEWLQQHEAFADQYARARSIQADVMADETVMIADTERDPAKARIRVDARKWFSSKLVPKKYGDRVSVGVGQDPDASPVGSRVEVSGEVKLEPGDAYLRLITGKK